jgi:Cell Wall Hydrolase
MPRSRAGPTGIERCGGKPRSGGGTTVELPPWTTADAGGPSRYGRTVTEPTVTLPARACSTASGFMPWMAPRLAFGLVVAFSQAGPAWAAPSGREVRCLALVAYAEAAVDGIPGMTAVIRVVRNRMADPRFPDDACAVIAQVAQFQPIAQSEVLQKVARDPEGYSIPQVLGLRSPESRQLLATAHRLARAAPTGADPTGGALYFVNPAYMQPHLCPWFAKLKRTAAIGGHVFMTEYQTDETPGPPALDCATAGIAAR